MTSIIFNSSQGVVFATAMAAAAVSGSFVLLAFKFQKSHSEVNPLRPCLSSGDKKKEKKKKKKRVRFAEDVVDPRGYCVDYYRRQRRRHIIQRKSEEEDQNRGRIPANHVALYNGLLKQRVFHRFSCAY